MEPKNLKDGQRLITKATATRDQFRMIAREKLVAFKQIAAATDEQMIAIAESHADLLRFMAMSIVHEVSLAAAQSKLEGIDDGRD